MLVANGLSVRFWSIFRAHKKILNRPPDFRQRKLVVETFGWLAFKEWFREPDFWR